MIPWLRRPPTLEDLYPSQRPRPRQEEEPNAPSVDEVGGQGGTSIWIWKLSNQQHFAQLLLPGTMLLFGMAWVATVALLVYHKKYFVIAFISVLFLATMASVFFRILTATRNTNSTHRQMQDAVSNPPPSYETVVASPPDYNQLFKTATPTTSNETINHSTLDPEDTADAAAVASNCYGVNHNSVVSLTSNGRSHEGNLDGATRQYCQELDAEDPPSYEEVSFSNL